MVFDRTDDGTRRPKCSLARWAAKGVPYWSTVTLSTSPTALGEITKPPDSPISRVLRRHRLTCKSIRLVPRVRRLVAFPATPPKGANLVPLPSSLHVPLHDEAEPPRHCPPIAVGVITCRPMRPLLTTYEWGWVTLGHRPVVQPPATQRATTPRPVAASQTLHAPNIRPLPCGNGGCAPPVITTVQWPMHRFPRLTTASSRRCHSSRLGQPSRMCLGVATCVCARKQRGTARDPQSIVDRCRTWQWPPPQKLRPVRWGTYPAQVRSQETRPPPCICRSRTAMRGMEA